MAFEQYGNFGFHGNEIWYALCFWLTRTETNVHIFLRDVRGGEEDSNSTTMSNTVAMQFQAGFLQGAELYVGGVPEDNKMQVS